MATSDPRDIRERLKPLRRILDDLDAAVDIPTRLRDEEARLNASMVSLRAEVATMTSRRRDLEAGLAQAEQEHEERLARQVVEFNAATASHAEALAELDEQRAEMEKLWSDRRSTLEHEYALDRDRLRGETEAAQARLDALLAELGAVEERIAPLLSRG